MEEDRRNYPRFEADWPVTVTTSRGEIQARIKDMSVSGAFICSDQIFQTGERFHLVIHSPRASPLALTAEVVWSRAPDNGQQAGMGVKFVW